MQKRNKQLTLLAIAILVLFCGGMWYLTRDRDTQIPQTAQDEAYTAPQEQIQDTPASEETPYTPTDAPEGKD